MIGIVVAWCFGSFLYFKVLFDFVFRSDISIFATFLMSVSLGILIFFSSGVYASKLLRFNLSPGTVPATLSDIIKPTFVPFILFSATYALLCRLIIFGFSKRLHRDIDIFRYRNKIDEDFIYFLIIVAAPVIIHYVMVVFSTYHNANRVPPYTEPEE